MDDFNDVMNKLGEFEKDIVKEQVKPEYEKTSKEKRDDFVKSVKQFNDWFRLPLNLLIIAILGIGASLMYLSVLKLTGNPYISVLSISISEAGILGWEFARERNRNTEAQTRIASLMRWWHVGTSVTLLVINFTIETATQMLSIKIDGIVYIIFAIIGLTSLFDLICFFIYGDNDRDATNKKLFNQKIEKLNADTTSRKLDSWARAEEIKSKALVEYWERNSGSLAELTGRIQASAQIRDEYRKAGLTEQEIDNMTQGITRMGTAKISKTEPVINQLPESIEPRQKRQYIRHNKPEQSVQNQEVETKTENFQSGTESKVIPEEW
jgi:hypothetical protein